MAQTKPGGAVHGGHKFTCFGLDKRLGWALPYGSGDWFPPDTLTRGKTNV